MKRAERRLAQLEAIMAPEPTRTIEIQRWIVGGPQPVLYSSEVVNVPIMARRGAARP